MTNHDQFDEFLDHALSEYRDAEPLSGLENRVLQRLQSQPVDRGRAMWMWGAIATCAVLVLIGVWIGVESPTPPKEGGTGHPASSTQPTSPKQETVAQKPFESPPAAGARQEIASQKHLTKQVKNKGLNGTAEAVPLQNVARERLPQEPVTTMMRGGFSASVARVEAASTRGAKSSQFPTPAPLTTEEHALLALLHSNPNVLPNPHDEPGDTTIAPLEIKPLAGSAAPTQENCYE